MKYLCRHTRLIFEIQAQRAGTTQPKKPEKNRTGPNRLGAKEKLLWPAFENCCCLCRIGFLAPWQYSGDSAFFGPFRVISFGRRHGEPSST
jgi:hypothetical protein